MSAIVKYLHSGLTGAPTLNGASGTLKAVLDAVLCDGWGAATVDSVTISGGIATVTRAAGHPFEPQTVALISGATVSGSGSINGEQVVLSTTATSYTFATTATGTVSGTVQHKFAPLGFNKVSGTNVGAYQITGSGGTGFWLRVDDTGTKVARVVGYESMSDVNTGTNAFPTASQFAGGIYWGKSAAANTTATTWAILGDDRGFYIQVNTTAAAFTHYFGDFNSLKAADAFNCILVGWNSDVSGSVYSGLQTLDLSASTSSATGSTFVARPYTGTGTPQSVLRQSQLLQMNTTFCQSGNMGTTYPNAADGSLILCPVNIIETSGQTILRGTLPGMLHIWQFAGTTTFNLRDIVAGVTGYAGRSFRVLAPGGYPMLIDNTGPWRS